MKTKFHLPVALIALATVCSCAKEELLADGIEASTSDQQLALKTFNYGMVKSYGSETILKWNELLGILIDEKLPVPSEAKIYVMVTLGMHDALNNVVPVYETYALNSTPVDAREISKGNIQPIADAAVSQAARDVLVTLFPAALAPAEALLDDVLASIPDDVARAKGVETGKQAATAILQKRQGDFPFLFTAYVPLSNDPGVYQANFPPYMFANPPIWPANAVYAPNLGNLTPFGIASGDQFMEEAPYAVDSPEYAADFNEVKDLGCAGCAARTPEQTEIATFWAENPASSTNRLARTFITKFELDGWEAARLLALLEMGVMDSFIASFREKSEFVFWAPITAIRAGDADGNPATAGDPAWTSLRPTPPVFEFSATQAYASGAASELFRQFFKKDEITFATTSPYYLPGTERSFARFSDFSAEQSSSRIYQGHHFRHSTEVGEKHGIELGRYIFENKLRALKIK